MITLKLLALGISATTAYVVFKTLGAVVAHQEAQLHLAMKFAGLE